MIGRLIAGLILAFLVYYIAGLFLPSPIPMLLGLLVFLAVFFGNSYYGRWL